jgi:uncharacterized protein YigE (DUF2233 family)
MSRSTLHFEPPIFPGLQHGIDDAGTTHLLMVSLATPTIRLQTVLSSCAGVECNSVNHWRKDLTSNCQPPYPFEPVEAMLARYQVQGAVAVINTDYFGPDGDHGAQGLAVRNGVRLDGLLHGVHNQLATLLPSLAFTVTNQPTLGIPESNQTIDNELLTTYYNTVGGWPLLVQNHEVVNLPCTSDRSGYDPAICDHPCRSAAGITADGRLILVTAQKNAHAMARYLVENFQVCSALSFDGGRSSSMAWVDEQEQIQSFRPLPGRDGVAQGLLVFSEWIHGEIS